MAKGNTTVKKLMDKAKRNAMRRKLGTCARWNDKVGPVAVEGRDALILVGKCNALSADKLKVARPFGWRRYA